MPWIFLDIGNPLTIREAAIAVPKSNGWLAFFRITKIPTAAKKIMIWRPVRIVLMFLILLTIGIFEADSAASNQYSLTNMSLSEANDGSTIDVTVGTNLNVFLGVSPQEVYRTSCLWSNITMPGDTALQKLQRVVLLPTGVTGAFFQAIRPGVVQLKSRRYNCSKELIIESRVNVRVA
jgi:hypothetical protein